MATSGMISGVSNVVFNALQTQARYAIDFKDQFEILKTKLDLMKAFLSTENLRLYGSHLEMVLPSMRKLIYEAEDILTDCQVRDEYWNDGSSACSWKFSPLELAFLYRTGKKLNKINLRIRNIEKTMHSYPRREVPINLENNAYQGIRYSSESQDYDPSEIIGLQNDIEKIKGWMFSSNEELRQVGVLGMGGLGKTTIAREIFNDRDVIAYFDKMIWVTVSNNFTEERIMRVMLKQLGWEGSELYESTLVRQIHRILSGKNCLIVMDDVWRMEPHWWSKLCGKSSFHIITSRNEDVIKSMGVDSSRIHRPKLLDENQSWSLLCKFAFPKSRGNCPNNQFEKVGRGILKKCCGLPLAIKTIGALLAPKVDSLAEWRKIDQNFHDLTTKEQNCSNSVMASLQLSYDELPTYLKQCILSFSIYPEDVEIRAEQIVLWWVGEGLIYGNNTRTAIELGYEYLHELASRCLIDVVERRHYDGKVYSCKMHDLIREMIIKIANDEFFCSFNEQGIQELTEASRWLGFTSDMDPQLLKKSSKLRALLLMSSDPVCFGRNVKLLRSLRVLDFSNNNLDTIKIEDLWNSIISLKRLAYLNLKGVANLKQVPDSIRKLRNLQILVFTQCNNLTTLHPSTTNLKRLTVLDVGSCNLDYLPNGLERLIHLQELSGFRVGRMNNTQSCRFSDLLELKQLRVLRMNIDEESEISETEWNVLSQLEKLKVLAIDAEDCKEKSVSEMLDMIAPPPRLQELYVTRYQHEILPKWINPEKLPSLQYLCLEQGNPVELQTSPLESDDSSSSAWVLEGLRLMFMPKLEMDWQNLEKDMPLLRFAEVSHCFNLKNFPDSSNEPRRIWRKNQD